MECRGRIEVLRYLPIHFGLERQDKTYHIHSHPSIPDEESIKPQCIPPSLMCLRNPDDTANGAGTLLCDSVNGSTNLQ